MQIDSSRFPPVLIIVTAVFPLLIGCAGGDTPVDVPEPLDFGATDTYRDGWTTDGADTADDTGLTDDGHWNNRPDYCPDWCYPGDFCETEWRCQDDTVFWSYEFYTDECGCDGHCWPDGPFVCPVGSFCYAINEEGDTTQDACHGDECNPGEGRGCSDGFYCETAQGQCDGPGACIVPGAGFLFGHGEETWEYVCGCDGRTYRGWHERSLAGVGASHEGQCCDTATLGFTLDNPDGFTVWTACASAAAIEPMPDDLKSLLGGATFGKLGPSIGCPAGTGAYVGNVLPGADGGIDATQFDMLCRLASFAGVSMVALHASDFCEKNCYTGLRCGETGCPSPCGCCPCNDADFKCADEQNSMACSPQGCWVGPSSCSKFESCTAGADGGRCRPSCPIMKDALTEFAALQQPCAKDDDCQAIPGFCDRTDGPCWLPWNGLQTVPIKWVNEFLHFWDAGDCRDQTACGCGPEPAVKCPAGTCVLVD